jgi:hypothetical protein
MQTYFSQCESEFSGVLYRPKGGPLLELAQGSLAILPLRAVPECLAESQGMPLSILWQEPLLRTLK